MRPCVAISMSTLAIVMGAIGLLRSTSAEPPSIKPSTALPTKPATAPIDFEAQIAPVLLRRCGSCHNPAGKATAGGLDLLNYDAALAGGKSGEPAIKPGDLDNSYVVTRIESGEMPPEGKGQPLTADEFATLKQWIAAGATWPKGRTLALLELTGNSRTNRDWWSLKPVANPSVPAVKDAAWVRNPIDAFVLARLEAQGSSRRPPLIAVH